MTATTACSATRGVVILVDLPPNRRTSTIPHKEPSLGAANLAEPSATRGSRHERFRAATATRVLRQATPRLDQDSRIPAVPAEPGEAQPMDGRLRKR